MNAQSRSAYFCRLDHPQQLFFGVDNVRHQQYRPIHPVSQYSHNEALALEIILELICTTSAALFLVTKIPIFQFEINSHLDSFYFRRRDALWFPFPQLCMPDFSICIKLLFVELIPIPSRAQFANSVSA